MDKRYLHHLGTKVRRINPWYLLVLLLVSGAVSAFALRQNNLTMVQLREAVYQADEANQDVEGALQRLRAYVHRHMNTDVSVGDSAIYPPIHLKYTYQRLQQAEKQRIQTENSQIYTDAQRYCEQQNPTDFSGRNRIPCIEQYVSERGTKARVIPDAMYKFDFVSAAWSPDVAGFSVLATIFLSVLLTLRLLTGYWLKRLL